MGRKHAPQPLALSDPADTTALGDKDRRSPRPNGHIGETNLTVTSPSIASTKSPRSPRSPFSKFNHAKKSPTSELEPSMHVADDLQYYQQQPQQQHSPRLHQQHQHQHQHQHPHQQQQQSYRPDASQYPPISSNLYHSKPSSPQPAQTHFNQHQEDERDKHSRSGSRFFNFNKGSRPSNQLHQSSHHTDNTTSETMSRGADYSSMPDRAPSKSSKYSDHSAEHTIQKPAPSAPSRSELSLNSTNEYAASPSDASRRENKPKGFGLLKRTKSVKGDGHLSPRESQPLKMAEPERAQTFHHNQGQAPLRTAPIQPEAHDRSFRHMMGSGVRNHSADRVPRDTSANKEQRNDKDHARSHPSSFRDNSGSNFLNNLRTSGTRAADMLSKGIFGKGGRSGSTNEREPAVDDEHYVIKVINLPLAEQTRLTRISKRLEDSRDKTEFWMPAFPWRAIDYLNYKGSDVEGLYRVPGSGPQIKKWQRKFDEELDVDLFKQDDLYDINIIGSMLKAWLRELPDELFPKEAQERIARECAGAEQVPQMLIDELSNLSPFNYYLLFAITCHLSLLLAHSDKNKMDFRNLCICFQPCMKIDAFCFKFLVCDWRQCWQGCKNEAAYIEQEYMLFDQPPPQGLGDTGSNGSNGDYAVEERPVSSSENSKPPSQQRQLPRQRTPEQYQSTQPGQNGQTGRLRKKGVANSGSNGSNVSQNSTISSNLTLESQRETPARAADLRPLSPIKPLSPLGF